MPTPLMPGDELVDPSGLVARFLRTTASDAGLVLEIE